MKIADFRLLIVLCLTALNAFGFEATLTIQPPLIQLSESATLSVEVRGAKNPSPPVLPDIPGLRFASTGQSTQMSWNNGKSDHFTVFNFQIYPQKSGTFTIGPFDYKVNGATKTLQGELKVVASSRDAQQAQNWSDLVFARLQIDCTNAYVQEPFGLTLSIYSRQGLQMAGNVNLTGMPETGLDGLQWQEVQGGRDMINNTIYDIRRFQTHTRAMSSGIFKFKPLITVQVVVPNQNNSSRSSFADPFFNSMFQRTETRPVDLPVEETVLTVKPLPEKGKPTGFGGAVGQFEFQVSARPLAVHPGDPVTLTMTLSGKGNFDRITPPALPDDSAFRLFGDAVRTQQETLVQFEQVISPRTADIKEIPSIPFSFFDTQSGTYRTVNSKLIPITVTATSNSTAQIFAAKNSIVLPPPDETPFATKSDLQRIETELKTFWQRIRPWLWIPPVALGLGLFAFFGWRLQQVRRHDTARVRRQKAPKAARKALHAAGHARRQNDATAFYDALWAALISYFDNRLNLPPGEVTSAVALQALDKKGFDPEQLNALRIIFEEVETNRYGRPGIEISPEKLNRLQNGLEQILKRCERTRL